MVWIVWLVLCAGPPAIVYLKGRDPVRFIWIALGLSAGPFLFGWGFMSLTGAQRWTATLSGQVLGFIGLVIAYVLAVMANPAETGQRPKLWRSKTEAQCPNCAGFLPRGAEKCPFCGADIA